MAFARQLIVHSSGDTTRCPMSSNRTVTQPVLPAILLAFPETYIVPFLLPQCCVCWRIRDETGSLPSRMAWVTLESYRGTHNLPSTDLHFTHCYCPDCLLEAQTRMREFFREKRSRSVGARRKARPLKKQRSSGDAKNCGASPREVSEDHRRL